MPRRKQDSGDVTGAATNPVRSENGWIALLVLMTLGQGIMVVIGLIG
jgi:hypothetical protein